MKIVILGTAHPYRGGLAAMNERLAQELSGQGHEVVIYNFTLQYPGFLFPGKSQYTDEAAPQGLKIIRKINSVCPFNWLKVGRELRKMRPDLLIIKFWLPFMGPALGTIARLARKNHHTRVICIADNMIPHEKRPGDRLFTKYFTKGVDGYIAMSHEVYADVEKLVAHPLRRFTPHPIYDHYGEIIPREEALKALKLDAAYRYLLFFGFIRDYKGLDWLLQAMADSRLKDIRLIIAGEFYSDSEPYLRLIRELGLEEKVILHTDYIPNEQINRYFCAADLVVQPYKTATQSGVTQ
ncbi:MAG: glycosyltransferase, partial [Odoribacter sp.]|nr:glycosyltransferase [Odoribacter sp.]